MRQSRGRDHGQISSPRGRALYDAMVRMAQPFSLRYPLWTDRETSAPSMAILLLRCDTPNAAGSDGGRSECGHRQRHGRFRSSYDDSNVEPTVLPTRVPNLLINGRTELQWHGDQHSAAQLDRNRGRHHHLVNNPSSQLADLLKFVQGPDFRRQASSMAKPEFSPPTKMAGAAS